MTPEETEATPPDMTEEGEAGAARRSIESIDENADQLCACGFISDFYDMYFHLIEYSFASWEELDLIMVTAGMEGPNEEHHIIHEKEMNAGT